ncbi:MAG: NYN domain-containing protein [Anaerolineae bacterium]|nr:NYN domain-containing protein [Anaerolineae bacterium]
MAAYLVVDVDNLLQQFRQRGIPIDLQEMAVGLRGGAALAAGLVSADRLKSIAVANWQGQQDRGAGGSPNAQRIFKAAGYEIFDMPHRASLADALILHYFSFDPDPVDELILATTSADLIPLIRRVKTTRNARIRVWGTENVVESTEFENEVIFQPLESLLGIQTKNVAVYIDFENIAISLTEQGFTVNLDHLLERFVAQAKAHGQVVKMAAYAPWGQRGSLPPLVDSTGREVADEAPSKLMLANVDPVFNLPGKNSADMRIAKDVITDSGHDDSADVYIMASGDRDFNQVLNTLRTRGKTVIVWGVRGSTSRMLENNPGISVEYIEDFTNLQTHQSLSSVSMVDDDSAQVGFTPSQWSSVIVQFDRLVYKLETDVISIPQLVEQLRAVGAVVSLQRGEDLVLQAVSLGILTPVSATGNVVLNAAHPIVEKTRLIRDRIVLRVKTTLDVRGWEYVNYGFLLKGLAMDRELDRPGCNYSDQWRSDWIDCLVRERVLQRELLPHRHNQDDLVPVIKLNPEYELVGVDSLDMNTASEEVWEGVSLDDLESAESDTADMVRRVVVSVEQFTSFRSYEWCPLGSLHKRLLDFDRGTNFQRSVEYLLANDSAEVKEYPNPQSDYFTKGISLRLDSAICRLILNERDTFIRLLLHLYERNMPISEQHLKMADSSHDWNFNLWFSIMQAENVLNDIPGRPGQYSLFRTHHTVNLVADARKTEQHSPR